MEDIFEVDKKTTPHGRISARSQLIGVTKTSCRENGEVDKIVALGRICERSQVIEVPKIFMPGQCRDGQKYPSAAKF